MPCFVRFYPETVHKESALEIWLRTKNTEYGQRFKFLNQGSLYDLRLQGAGTHSPDKVGFSFLVVAWWIAVSPTTLSNLNFINSFLFFSKHPAPAKKEKKAPEGFSKKIWYFHFQMILFRVWTSNCKIGADRHLICWNF